MERWGRASEKLFIRFRAGKKRLIKAKQQAGQPENPRREIVFEEDKVGTASEARAGECTCLLVVWESRVEWAGYATGHGIQADVFFDGKAQTVSA